MASLDRVLEKLDFKKTSTDYIACCPRHDDKQASLSISTGANGKVLLKCFAGCSFDAIVAALGLKPSDLMGDKHTSSPGRFEHSNSPGYTLAEFSVSKQIPLDSLRSHGVSECT